MTTVPFSMEKEELGKTVSHISSKFLESIAILDQYWFMCTSICCYYHENDSDDCTDKSRVGAQSQRVAQILICSFCICESFVPFVYFHFIALLILIYVSETGSIETVFRSCRNVTNSFLKSISQLHRITK